MPDYSKTRIQVRRGTSAQWNTADPVLGQAELGFDSGSGVLKVGDGTNNWNHINNIVFMTQAAYNALGSYDAGTLYYIV